MQIDLIFPKVIQYETLCSLKVCSDPEVQDILTSKISSDSSGRMHGLDYPLRSSETLEVQAQRFNYPYGLHIP